MKRFRPRHAQIHLPALNGQEAFLLVAMLERAVSAIWRAHGDVMAADLQQRALPDATTHRDDDIGGRDDNSDIGEDDLDFWSLVQKSEITVNDDPSNSTADSVKIFEGESYRQKEKDKPPALLSSPSSVRRAPMVGARRAPRERRPV